jgi:formylmethanofuran dehydrogenase subunit B
MAVADSSLRRDVVCPFCGLACDDLAVAVEDGRIIVREGGCDAGRAGFERQIPDAPPLVAGREAGLDAAIAKAAEVLRASRQPLFAGLATDVAGMRAVIQLAERTGGIVDHAGGDGLFRNLRVVQDSGWMTTTLSEVRNHADLLLVVGPDPTAQFPRFFQRCVGPPQTLYTNARPTPQLVRLGPPDDRPLKMWDVAAIELPCPLDRLPEAVAALRCLVNDRPLRVEEVAGLPVENFGRLAAQLKAARYGVVSWMAGAFDFAGAELLVQSLADLVRDLNRTTRCAALPLAGGDNAVGANQVCTWQSGVPLRTSFAGGAPEHDPLLHTTSRLIGAREVDALVWVSAFRPLPPPSTELPTIVIATPGVAFARPPDVFIPVGTPGIDHAGAIFRTDAVVALPLAALRSAGALSVADVLARIDRVLSAGGAP